MDGIFLAIGLAYLLGGAIHALGFTVFWRKRGCTLSREWAGLAAIAFILWPLIPISEIFDSIKNRERNRAARLRRRV